jgi:spore maturation protein CgeB
VYFDNIDECVEKINFYTDPKNEHLRLKIASNGFNKVRDKHTTKARVSKLLYYLNENIIYK